MCQRSGVRSARMAKIPRSPEEEAARRERRRKLAWKRTRCRRANPDVRAREAQCLRREANPEACAKHTNAVARRKEPSASLFRQCSRSGAGMHLNSPSSWRRSTDAFRDQRRRCHDVCCHRRASREHLFRCVRACSHDTSLASPRCSETRSERAARAVTRYFSDRFVSSPRFWLKVKINSAKKHGDGKKTRDMRHCDC